LKLGLVGIFATSPFIVAKEKNPLMGIFRESPVAAFGGLSLRKNFI
jgi:hypothetical protein